MIESLDITAAACGFLATIFFIKINKYAWPLSLVAIAIDIFLYMHKGLYGDFMLQCVYLISVFYGWYEWLYGGKNKKELPISSMSVKLTLVLTLIAVVGIAGLTAFLKYKTNSQVPYLDATTTILSLIAQWMICRKIIQCWFLWFFVDAIYVGLYFFKGLPAHGVLNTIYVSMAVAGYITWRRQMSTAKPIEAEADIDLADVA